MSPVDAADRFAWTPRLTSRRIGAAVLLGYLVLVVWALVHGTTVTSDPRDYTFEQTDAGLYRAIVERMDDGQGYYQAVSVEQPQRNYPTSPVVTVREPTLAWLTSTLGKPVMLGAMWVLTAGALVLSLWVFEHTERGRGRWIGTVLLAACSVGIFAFPGGVYVHEVWMSLLVYLGLMCRGAGWVRASVVLVLAAALVRELAAPVMALMLVIAWRRGRRSEAMMWAAALVVFVVFYGTHAVLVSRLVEPSGLDSSSWLALGGWPFVIDSVREPSALSLLPFGFAAVVVPLGLLGWLSRSGPLFDTVSAVLLSYMVLFCFVGRPDNAYWGAFLAVFIIPGVLMGVGSAWSLARGSGHPAPR